VRNWRRTSRLRAPRAISTPISLVRSTTATSMMFMITMPPTPRETDATSSDRMKAAAEICRQRVVRLSAVMTPKGSGPRKGVWRKARISARTSSTEGSTPATPPRALTSRFKESRVPNWRR